MGPPWRIDHTTYRTMSECSYHEATSRSPCIRKPQLKMAVFKILLSVVSYENILDFCSKTYCSKTSFNVSKCCFFNVMYVLWFWWGFLLYHLGMVPKDSLEKVTSRDVLLVSLYIIMCLLSALGILLALSLLSFNIKFRKQRWVFLHSLTFSPSLPLPSPHLFTLIKECKPNLFSDLQMC